MCLATGAGSQAGFTFTSRSLDAGQPAAAAVYAVLDCRAAGIALKVRQCISNRDIAAVSTARRVSYLGYGGRS